MSRATFLRLGGWTLPGQAVWYCFFRSGFWAKKKALTLQVPKAEICLFSFGEWEAILRPLWYIRYLCGPGELQGSGVLTLWGRIGRQFFLIQKELLFSWNESFGLPLRERDCGFPGGWGTYKEAAVFDFVQPSLPCIMANHFLHYGHFARTHKSVYLQGQRSLCIS